MPRKTLSALFFAPLLAAGCASSQPTGSPVILDPAISRPEVGGSDDLIVKGS